VRNPAWPTICKRAQAVPIGANPERARQIASKPQHRVQGACRSRSLPLLTHSAYHGACGCGGRGGRLIRTVGCCGASRWGLLSGRAPVVSVCSWERDALWRNPGYPLAGHTSGVLHRRASEAIEPMAARPNLSLPSAKAGAHARPDRRVPSPSGARLFSSPLRSALAVEPSRCRAQPS
jgi:hypothetical protein